MHLNVGFIFKESTDVVITPEILTTNFQVSEDRFFHRLFKPINAKMVSDTALN